MLLNGIRWKSCQGGSGKASLLRQRRKPSRTEMGADSGRGHVRGHP